MKRSGTVRISGVQLLIVGTCTIILCHAAAWSYWGELVPDSSYPGKTVCLVHLC